VRRRLGASPLVVLVNLAALGGIAWAASHMLHPWGRRSVDFLAWIVAGAILHDLVALPLYTAADRIVRRALGPLARGAAVPVVNHLRFPAAASAILLLVGLPLILDRGPENYERVSGVAPHGYLAAWLELSAAAFALSGAVYAVRVARARRA
jgi:hypothetical protein